MTPKALISQIALGEDSKHQFKVDVRNAESLAAEMAAFANTDGGRIFIGVADDGSTPGLGAKDVSRINQLIGNAASQLFVVKAIRYPGNAIHVSHYLDTEDFEGPLQKVFADALGFIMRNLHKVQAGRGVNAPGRPEIPETVFEELLVNALVHRDYLVNAPIRLFIFDNRIEIISPGHLPNNLTVEKIRTGNSNIRNPILVSYVAKGLLPYHGLGSGIKRALEEWPEIEFIDDHDGCLFQVTVTRKPVEELDLVDEGEPKNQNAPKNEPEKDAIEPNSSGHEPKNKPKIAIATQVLDLIRSNPKVSYDDLAQLTHRGRSSMMRTINKLKASGHLKRIGAKNGGHWEIIE